MNIVVKNKALAGVGRSLVMVGKTTIFQELKIGGRQDYLSPLMKPNFYELFI